MFYTTANSLYALGKDLQWSLSEIFAEKFPHKKIFSFFFSFL